MHSKTEVIEVQLFPMQQDSTSHTHKVCSRLMQRPAGVIEAVKTKLNTMTNCLLDSNMKFCV